MIWLQLVSLAHSLSTISKKKFLEKCSFNLGAEVKIEFTTAKEFTGRETALFRKFNEIRKLIHKLFFKLILTNLNHKCVF